jgi:signal transduction histidine kinase
MRPRCDDIAVAANYGRAVISPRHRARQVWSLVRDLPLVSDPAVAAFLGRGINILFTVAALAMFSVAWPVLPLTHSVLVVLMPVVAGLASLPVILAWARPALGLTISLAAAVVLGTVVPRVDGWGWRITVVHIIALTVLAAMTFLRGPLRLTPLYWAATCAVFAVTAPHGARAGWIAGFTVLAVVCGLLRVLARSRRDLAHESELKEVADARTAVLAERARIARDLHDVVAHRMSVVVVAAQTARYRVEGIGPEADAELQAIAGMAREALDEVRGMLGVLRVDDSAPQAPTPGLAQIPDLVEATRSAGVAVTARLDPPPVDGVGEGTALAAYRIVQEALTNAVRHAPGAPIDVAVGTHGDSVQVTVTNPMTPAPAPTGVGGHGVPGMTERAHAVGGSVTVGPDPVPPDGPRLFRVAASLPTRPPHTASTPTPTPGEGWW